MADQPLALQIGKDGQRPLDRAFGRRVVAQHAAHVDHFQHVEPEIAQIIVHRGGDFRARHCRMRRLIRAWRRSW
jgi:hypothetical protein